MTTFELFVNPTHTGKFRQNWRLSLEADETMRLLDMCLPCPPPFFHMPLTIWSSRPGPHLDTIRMLMNTRGKARKIC